MEFRAGEFVAIDRRGRQLAWHVPASALYGLDPLSLRLLQRVQEQGPVPAERLSTEIASETGATGEAVRAAAMDLLALGLLLPSEGAGSGGHRLVDLAPRRKGISALVVHVAHTCNLACHYCYADEGRYGGRDSLMTEETARRYVDFLFDSDPEAPRLRLTFFGGEPLLNFKVVRLAADLARERAAREGRKVLFAMTTNGTLVTDEVADYLAEIDCAVTVSIDGSRETNDALRPFHGGQGSYDRVVARIGPLLERCRTVARVTLTRKDLDAVSIVEHLLGVGFREVGITPVDAGDPRFDLSPRDYDTLLDGLAVLSDRYRDHALEGRRYGFANVETLLKAFHQGHNKDYACGAAVAMVAGSPDGKLSLCHRFVGKPEFQVGTLSGGLERREELLDRVHLANRTDCGSCWARYVCSGGCHYANHLHGGDVRQTHLAHCDYLRAWYRKGLEVYADIALDNPAFIARFIDPDYLCAVQ